MRIKDASVETKFHPMLTAFLFKLSTRFIEGYAHSIVITSGSESGARHGRTSLHYATPAQAADLRSWEFKHLGIIIDAIAQKLIIDRCADDFCEAEGIPRGWIEIILENDHFHIEYQPKRQD
jgi:hypothetical protein